MVLAELGGKLRQSLAKLNLTSSLDTEALDSLLGGISRALLESDVNVHLVVKVRDNIKKRVGSAVEKHQEQYGHGGGDVQSIQKLVQKAVMDELTALLTTPSKQVKAYTMKRNKPNVILFVGLQGAGKTTTVAKFANYYQRKGWKVAMVCADTFRAGAFDQLKQNATKLRVPFYGSYTEADPVLIAEDGVEQFIRDKYEIIIVDTSGRHKQEGALFEEMQEISAAIRPDNTVFVMDATQGQAIYDQAMGFREAVSVGSVIVTKLDGHAKGGGALSAVAATQSPIIFLGSGERFDDFEVFHAQSFVSKLLGMGDVRGFMMKEMKDVKSSADKDELLKKMSKGEFTLRDLYKQYQDEMKIGPMGQLMGRGYDEEHKKKVKMFMTIMDSMTDKELDGVVDWHGRKVEDTTIESRIKRIAKGSGTHPLEVKLLLQTHRQQESVVSEMSKSGMFKGTAKQKQMIEHMRKNPATMNSHLNRMDPKVLSSMGGRDVVKQMLQSGNIPGGFDGSVSSMSDIANAAQMIQQMRG
eukprot:CAMPEP_0176478308 /NCGR_PEP_ID=MMETSP0200_2-20121128/1116_1 /TAXON_ID=947934 /ORGANISM="Chaetoceros sp., Strain GSL56" /LENGTH=524 /DNA_ID=CAMNT_0017874235 /DNA_START=28 /DNA_END=1602 /DNA_ORIENTATION=-